MPKYTFVCPSCGANDQLVVGSHIKKMKCMTCKDSWMKRQLPTLSGPPDVQETVDKYTNQKQVADQREMVEQRRDEYYWSVEVPRLVNSGQYGIDTMLDLGWITIDDKDQIHVQTKPPHKR
jgi:predicted  nucleic acid-binding Zn-ribbon protein